MRYRYLEIAGVLRKAVVASNKKIKTRNDAIKFITDHMAVTLSRTEPNFDRRRFLDTIYQRQNGD